MLNKRLKPQLKLTVIDKNILKNEILGEVTLPLNQFPFLKSEGEVTQDCLDKCPKYDVFLLQK